MRRIGLFGSTGSIGRNVLEVVRSNPDAFTIACLTAQSNVELLARQACEFRPEAVCIADENCADSLRKELHGKGIRVMSGPTSLVRLARECEYDMMIGAIVGFAGLLPTLEAIKAGRRIGLANKETLVVAGEIVIDLAKSHGIDLIPIDSEHSALFQCMVGEDSSHIRRLILTASGGPFRSTAPEEFEHITPEMALRHPNWNMGAKITIDSATLMNKGLEIIEAHWLFGISPERIDVVVHPQSIIHSMVEYVDSSVKAQMGLPDMKIPIQYALAYPERLANGFETLDLVKLGRLDFFAPDRRKFPCLQLAYEALRELGTMPSVVNAANEVAVECFLRGQLGFTGIPQVIEKAMMNHTVKHKPTLEDVLDADRWARDFARREAHKN